MRHRAVALAALLVLSVVAPAGAGLVAAENSAINYGASAAPGAAISANVSVDNFDRSSMSVLEYEDDSGEVVELDGVVNDSEDVDDLGNGHVNEFRFVPTDVYISDYWQFPRNNESLSAVHNESDWSTNTGISTSDVETTPGAEAIEFATNGSFTSGDQATATYDLTSVGTSSQAITSDVDKRTIQLALTVETLDSNGVMEFRAVDSDGDYVNATINASRSSGEDYIASATGSGYVYQRQVGKMTVHGSGDGTMSEISKIEVVAQDADVTAHVVGMNFEKTSKWDLGTEYTDTDSDDDDLETNELTEHKSSGVIAIHDLSTMGSAFDAAEMDGLQYPVNMRVRDLPSEDVSVSYEDAPNYPAFSSKLDAYYRLQLPDAYDLSWSDAALEDEVAVPGSRYEVVEKAEGVGDTEFSEISDSTWSDKTDSYGSQGAEVELDATIQAGQEIAVHYTYPITADEKSALQSTGVAGGPIGGSGGLGDIPVIGGVLAALAGLWARVTGRL